MQSENQDALLKGLLEQVSKLSEKVADLESLKKDIPTSEDLYKEIKITKYGNFTVKPFKLKRKRGLGAIPLLESEIREAQSKAKSGSHAAKLLNVGYQTYKKYAKMYGIHEVLANKQGKGVPKPKNPNTGKYPLTEILDGKFPEYALWKLKDRLIRAGLKPAACEQCGYCERRITDNKIPLLLVFEDNNEKNHRIENIKVFCYNCSFTAGRIWVKIKDRKRWLNDPDRLQGSQYDTEQRY